MKFWDKFKKNARLKCAKCGKNELHIEAAGMVISDMRRCDSCGKSFCQLCLIKAKDPGSSSVMCPSCGRTKITFREKQLVDELQEKYGAELGLYIAEEQMCRELGDRKCVQKVLGLQADFHCRRGNLDEAMRLYEEKELICRELENQEGLAAALGGQAEVFEEKGDLDEAFQLYREKERIYRELEDNVGISMTLVQQALLLDKCGKSDKARARARDAYEIARLETSYLGNALREYVEENVGSLLH